MAAVERYYTRDLFSMGGAIRANFHTKGRIEQYLHFLSMVNDGFEVVEGERGPKLNTLYANEDWASCGHGCCLVRSDEPKIKCHGIPIGKTALCMLLHGGEATWWEENTEVSYRAILITYDTHIS